MPRIDELERRLNTLEKEVAIVSRSARRYRSLCAFLLLMFLGLGSLAATNRSSVLDVIQTRRLEVVDREGNLVLAASSETFGGQLDLWNKEGQNLLRASASVQGGDLAIWNKGGTNVFGAFATPTGGETGIWNKEGKRVFRVAAKSGGGGKLDLGNEKGQTVVALNTIKDIGGAIAILNTRGNKMFIAGTHENGGVINLWNRRGVPIFITGFGADGQSGSLQLLNARGNQVFTAGVDDDGDGLITIWNAGGRQPRTFSAIK